MTMLKVELRNHQQMERWSNSVLFFWNQLTWLKMFFFEIFVDFFQVGDQETFYYVLYVAALMERF